MSLRENEVSNSSGFPLPRGMPKVVVVLTIVTLAATALAMAVKGPRLAVKECRTLPRPMLLRDEVEATMTICGNVPCPIVAQLKTDAVHGVDVTIPPSNGKLTARGRTGFVYRPNYRFRGEDYFEYAMDRPVPNDATRSVVKVRVSVD